MSTHDEHNFNSTVLIARIAKYSLNYNKGFNIFNAF